MRRVVIAEFLDSDQGTPSEVADSLADLRWINRYFGGSSTTISLLRRASRKSGLKTISYLDVGGASGDNSHAAQQALASEGVALEPTILDRAPSHFSRDGNGQMAIAGDAFHLPFRDHSFDVVGSSLFLHHLEPKDVGRFLTESLRVCRLAAVVNDLRRGWVHYAASMAGWPLFRSRITRHDALASVRRAYTQQELSEMAHALPHSRIELSNHYLFRIGLVIWK